MARKAVEVDEVPEGLVGEVEAAVRASGAVALGKLTRVKLSRRAQGMLHEALGRRGLERTGKAVRVPLREQVARAIAGGPLAMASLRKAMRGMSGAGELKLVVADLVRGGRAVVVMKGAVEHVATPSTEVMAREELAALGELARALGKAAASVRARAGRPARSLLRPDVVALLEEGRDAMGGGGARQRSRGGEEGGAAMAGGEERAATGSGAVGAGDPVAMVVDAVRRHARGATGLAPVPAVARALAAALPGARVGDALLSAAAAGLIELRPESGVDLLAPADAALCPRGADGWPLSWARALEGGGT